MKEASVCVCVCVPTRRRGGGMPAESHPLSSLHPPTDPSIPPPPLPRWWQRLEGQPPCSDTLTHIRRHTPPRCVTTNLPLPIIPACSCIYPHLLFCCPRSLSLSHSLSLSLHPCLSSTSPPRRVSQLLGKKEKCSGRQKWRRKRWKESKVVKAGACWLHIGASIHPESSSSLTEYPSLTRGEKRQREKVEEKKNRRRQ